MAPLTGYHGPPPLTLTATVTQWTLDVPTILLVVLLGGVYLRAVRTQRRETPWSRGRSGAFLGGLILILLCGVSFLGTYGDILFWARATQVIVLLMVAPLGLALGAPLELALATTSAGTQARLRALLASRVARVLTFPATASALLIAAPWVLYFTGWYQATLTNEAVDELTRLLLLGIGFLYFYSRLQLDPVPHRYPHLISICITFVEVIFDAALGLVLWLGPHLIAHDYYQALGRDWGPSLRLDQIIGAGVLWLIGDLAGVPFLAALVNRMQHDDEREAAEIDRVLDEREAATAGTVATPSVDTASQPAPLWWENDPILAERFRRDRPR